MNAGRTLPRTHTRIHRGSTMARRCTWVQTSCDYWGFNGTPKPGFITNLGIDITVGYNFCTKGKVPDQKQINK